MPAETTVEHSRGYVDLLRENSEFRRLWFGQIVSQLGDWLNTIALYSIALKLTGSGQSIALILVTRFLSTVFASPLAGVVADRFNRRKIMIISDLVRVVIVLGFLLIRDAQDVWLIYFLTVLQLVCSTFYEPARSASIPSVVEAKDLLTANAISAATWSAMLTLGAAIGGFITAWLGTNAAFIVDSLTYLISAAFIWNLQLPKSEPREPQKLSLLRLSGLADVFEGLAYVWQRPRIFATMLAKPGWGIGGGMLTLLAVFGEKVFPVGGKGALGIGVLYGVRGVGTALGPILLRRFVGSSREKLENSLGISFFIGGGFYALFGCATNYTLAIILLLIAYAGGSIVWTNATVLLQSNVEDSFRGRVFAAELALLTLTLAASNFAVGELLDRFAYSPQAVTVLIGLLAAFPGGIWFATKHLWRGKGAAKI